MTPQPKPIQQPYGETVTDHKAAVRWIELNDGIPYLKPGWVNLAACYIEQAAQLEAANEKLAQLGGEVGMLRIDISNERKARKEAESAKGTMPWVQALERRAKAAEAKLTAMDRENARLLGELAATCLKRKEAVRKCERIAAANLDTLVSAGKPGSGTFTARSKVAAEIRAAFPEDFKDD